MVTLHPTRRNSATGSPGVVVTAAAFLAPGCLFDRDLYESRTRALADVDGDGFTSDDGDCNDDDPRIRPDASESCDGVDEDCNGVVDDQSTDATTWFLDADGDGAGDGAEYVVACGPPTEAWVSRGDDCDDDNADRYPGAQETPYDDIDQDCDGADLTDLDSDGHPGGSAGTDCDDDRSDVYPDAGEAWGDLLRDNDCDGVLEPIEESYAGSTWFGEQEEAHFGERLAPLGDVDGDGTAEFLAAAVWHTDVGEYAGRVYLVGEDAPGPAAELPRVDPPSAYSGFGAAMAAVPDIDGDGRLDFVTGATLWGSGAGAVFIISTNDLVQETALTVPDDAFGVIEGDGEGSFFGSSVASLDLNGDGLAELVVGEPFSTAGGASNAGRVFVFEGDLGGTRTTADADHRVDGSFSDMRLGNYLGDAGDQDGDGLADLIVSGEFGLTAALLSESRLAGDVEDIASVRFYDATSAAPEPVVVGDLDGDGRRDLVVLRDEIWVYTDLAGAVVTDIDPAAAALHTGDGSVFYQAENLGDIDGDGFAETFLTVPEYISDGGSWAGVLPGAEWPDGASMLASDLPFRAIPTRRDAFLGQRAEVVGDVDGDGWIDIAVGGYSGDRGAANSGSVGLLTVPQ
jgi:hypothetical protein